MTGNVVIPNGTEDYALPPSVTCTGRPSSDDRVIMYIARGLDLTPYKSITGEFAVNVIASSGSYDLPYICILNNSWADTGIDKDGTGTFTLNVSSLNEKCQIYCRARSTNGAILELIMRNVVFHV